MSRSVTKHVKSVAHPDRLIDRQTSETELDGKAGYVGHCSVER